MNRNLENKEFKGQIVAAIQEEAEWRRVKHFVVLLHTGRHNLFHFLLLYLQCIECHYSSVTR